MRKASRISLRSIIVLLCSCVTAGCATSPPRPILTPVAAAPPATFGVQSIAVVGRHIAQPATHACPATLRFGHSATTLSTRFTGDTISVWLQDIQRAADGSPGSVYDVIIDGQKLAPLVVQPLLGPWYKLATGLAHKEHSLKLVRRQEAQSGETLVGGIHVAQGAQAWAPAVATRRLWAIGDSITAGHGNLCQNQHDAFSFWTEDAARTYAVLAGDAFGADTVVVAQSGRGMWRNGDGTNTQTVPQIFSLVLPTQSLAYTCANEPKPDAIIINLGTNDLRLPLSDTDKAAYVGTYVAFLARLRHLAPDALLVPALGPMFTDDQGPTQKGVLTLARTLMRRIVAESNKARLGRVVPLEFTAQDGALGFGCQYHPNVATHGRMAQQLIALLGHELSWDLAQPR